MQKTVEYTEEVEKTDTITVCNNCAKEVDTHHAKCGSFHFCRECREDFGEDVEMPYEKVTKEWLQRLDAAHVPMKRNIRIFISAMTTSNILILVGVAIGHPFLGVAIASSALCYVVAIAMASSLLNPKYYPDRLQ